MDNDVNLSKVNEKLDYIMKRLNDEGLDLTKELQEPVNESPNPVVKTEEKIDALINKIKRYSEESIDPNFTQSLRQSLDEAIYLKERIDALDKKVDNNYSIYLRNKELLNQPRVPREIIDNQRNNTFSNNPIYTVPTQVELDKAKIQRKVEKKNGKRGSLNIQKEPSSDSNMEYKIGGELFGFLGAIIVLISMIVLGKSLLPDFLQGIAMFIIPVFILGVAELFERKFSPKFAKIISAIGVASGYVALFINYSILDTLSPLPALAIGLVFTIWGFILCKKKQNSMIKIISMIGFYFCTFTTVSLTGASDIPYFLTAACLLFISSIDMFAKTPQNKAFNYLGSLLNLFVISYISLDESVGNLFSSQPMALYISIPLSMCLLASAFMNFYSAKKDRAFKIFSLIILCLDSLVVRMFADSSFAVIGAIIIGIAFFMIEKEKANKKIYLLPLTLAYLPIAMTSATGGSLTVEHVFEYVISVGGFCGLVVLLQKFMEGNRQKLINTFILVVVMLPGLFGRGLSVFPFIIIMLFGFAFLKHYREASAFFVVPACETFLLNSVYKLIDFNEASIGICGFSFFALLFAWLLAYSPQLKDKNTHIAFNVMFGWMGLGFLVNLFNTSFITSTIEADVFIAYLVNFLCAMTLIYIGSSNITHIKNYDSKKIFMYIITVSVFAFTMPYVPNVLISILTLIIAAVSVVLGFQKLDKSLRVYGLVVSLIMIAKLVFVDLNAADTTIQALLYLIGGLLILAISYIYIKLEKKISQNKE